MRIWRNWNTYTLLVWMQNGTVAFENSLAVPREVKHRATIWPYKSTRRHIYTQQANIYPTEVKTCPHKNLHIVCTTLFTIAKKWQQLMSVNWWMNKLWHYTYNGILFKFKRKYWYNAPMWISLENIKLSEESDTKGCYLLYYYCMTLFIWNV